MLVVGAVLSLAACGGGTEVANRSNDIGNAGEQNGQNGQDGLDPPPVAPGTEEGVEGGSSVPAGFSGTWQGAECTSAGGGVFARSAIILTDGDTEQQSSTTVFSDSLCASPLLETRTFSRFDFGETVILADGSEAVEVDVTASGDSVVIPASEDAAAGLSDERFCGVTDWAVGVSFDTSRCVDVRAAIEPLIGRTVPQIYSVQRDDLLIGRFVPSGDRIAPEVRPTALDYLSPFRRVTEG